MVTLLLAIIYLAFISLGLPDSLLGSAWPSIHQELKINVSLAGIISIVICMGTIVSSIFSDRITKKIGFGKVTAISTLITAIALFGFSISNSFYLLIIFAIPYGIGAGGIDAALNTYAALHYKSSHMSWLHCMWGIGASLGPYIMGYALIKKSDWHQGYLYIGIIQIVLTFILFLSLPLWKIDFIEQKCDEISQDKQKKFLNHKQVLFIALCFFCYSSLEQSAILWGGTYFSLNNGIDANDVAIYGSLFCLGITLGRLLSGFLTLKCSDKQMIFGSLVVVFIGVSLLFVSQASNVFTIVAFVLLGLGCGPIYPSLIHITPSFFGKYNSQKVIGFEVAFAYLGTLVVPPFFGVLINYIGIRFFPFYLIVILVLLIAMFICLLIEQKH